MTTIYVKKRLKNDILKQRTRRLFRWSPKIDWFRILAELQYFGLDNSDVAEILNINPSNIGARWKCGACPSYESGRALLKLHRLVLTIGEKSQK